MNNYEWDKYADKLFKGNRRYWGSRTPEGILSDYRSTVSDLRAIRNQLKNPIGRRSGTPLKPSTIKQLEGLQRRLIEDREAYKGLIKCLVKYNLLPVNKLISGENRNQFVFSLRTMLELPEFGRAVYYANCLMECRYNNDIPSMHFGCIQKYNEYQMRGGKSPFKEDNDYNRKKLYDSMIEALEEILQKARKEKQRFLTAGTPWQSNYKKEENRKVIETQRQSYDIKGLKVLNGGLHSQIAFSSITEDVLSEEGRAFIEREKGKKNE